MGALNNTLLQFKIEQLSPSRVTITVPASIVDKIYTNALIAQQGTLQTSGFAKGSVPLEYIAQHYKSDTHDYLKEFLLNYFVTSFLHEQLRTCKLLTAGEPRLIAIQVEPHQNAMFEFQLSCVPSLELLEWKHLPFKAPKRKKYKDLDRQVDSFIKKELEQTQKHSDEGAQIGDLICLDIRLTHEHGQPFFDNHHETIWLRISGEEGDRPLREIFVGKKTGDQFSSNHKLIQSHFSNQLDVENNYCMTVKDLLHHNYFCLDQFKRFFKLKTNKEAYQKLIEVFSYRNDLSQRRSMAEEALKLLLSKHKFDIPNHVILRQQEKVIAAVQTNPDYHVYRIQKDFEKRIKQLAEKQIKEQLLLDQVAYHENITITHDDVKQYLNLMNRPRTKEFIYFDARPRHREQEALVPAQELMQACLREKAVNYIIYHLMRA
jgi:FKBP-type peptidyl-prolyl cis-trans isomerase (trigger factor)